MTRSDANPRIDLGLAVSQLSLGYGQTRTQEELAAFCDCDRSYIGLLERSALAKMKARLAPILAELISSR